MWFTHLVNYDSFLLQVDSKSWLELVQKRINFNEMLNREITLCATKVILLSQPSLALTWCLSKKKGNHEVSEPTHESELRKTYLYFVEIGILIHAWSLESESCGSR